MRDKATTAKQLAPALFAQRLQGSGATMFRTVKTKDEWRNLRRKSVLPSLSIILFVSLAALLLGDAIPQTTHAHHTKAQTPAQEPLTHTQQARLTASDGTANDDFGNAVAISGDTAVVGDSRQPGQANRGGAYVYRRSGTDWSERQKLLPPDIVNSDSFGASVSTGSLFGRDGALIVVGAPNKSFGGVGNRGVVYVFVLTNDSGPWIQEQLIAASDGALGDNFGASVAIVGDTLVVGAPNHTVGANTRQGAAYVFRRTGFGGWVLEQQLTASDGLVSDQLGGAVALSGNTAVLGAREDNFGATRSGKAYVFVRNGSTWSQQQKLIGIDAGPLGAFGNSVAINSNADTVAIGAFHHNEGLIAGRGAVYVFVRDGTVWTQQQKLLGSLGMATGQNAHFGAGVAVYGDTIVAGAPVLDPLDGNGRGAVYLFNRSGTTWTEHDRFLIPGAVLREFGSAVAMGGDAFIAGSQLDTVNGNLGQGSVYVFATGNSLSINDTSVIEGNSGTTQVTFTVTLSAADTNPVVVDYATSDDTHFVTATAGSDYVAASGVLTFNPGETSKTINVTVNGDTLYELDERFDVILSNPVNANVARQGACDIMNDDSPPAISINDVSQAEGNSGSTNFTFTVTLSAPSGLFSGVFYTTADGTATAGSDYQATSVANGVPFFPGETSKTITVVVNGDTQNEPDETFQVNLTGPLNATIARAQGTGTILNDDTVAGPSTVQFSLSNYSVGEGAGHVDVTVARTGDTSSTSSVDYRTTDTDTFTVGCSDTVSNMGAAYGRCDYATSVDTLTFLAGETTKTFAIPIIDDSLHEVNETFSVVLSNVTGASLGTPATATITIIDNDPVTGPNPIFNTPFFVRQHYLDFLSREPEASEPWTAVLNNCSNVNNNPACDRLTVSAAFFGSPEFQLKGYFVYRFYKLAFNRLPTYPEIVTDMRAVTGQTPARGISEEGGIQ